MKKLIWSTGFILLATLVSISAFSSSTHNATWNFIDLHKASNGTGATIVQTYPEFWTE